jgi:hypothetical protein
MNRRWEKQFFLMKKLRKMGNFLILSIALNASFLLIITYKSLSASGKGSSRYDFSPENQLQVASDVLKEKIRSYTFSFSRMTYARLLEELDNDKIILDNFKIKDLALSYLFTYFDFDLYRALNGQSVVTKTLKFHSANMEDELVIVLGLEEQEEKKIAHFIQEERWPFNSKGLYRRLKLGLYEDVSLKRAFYNTSEFYTFFTLLNRADEQMTKEEVLGILLEGHWELLEEFHKGQRNMQDLSRGKRRQLLLDYVAIGSVKATNIFIESEWQFILDNFEDKHLKVMLRQISLKEPSSRLFLKRLLLEDSRKDLWVKARQLLDQKSVSLPPSSVSEIARMKFTKSKEESNYKVKKNDTLWEIAKKFHVSLKEIKQYNRMYSDIIYENQELKIPR